MPKQKTAVKTSKENKNKAKTPVIFYGITGDLPKQIEKYISIAGKPEVITGQDKETIKYKDKSNGIRVVKSGYLSKEDVIYIDNCATKIYSLKDIQGDNQCITLDIS